MNTAFWSASGFLINTAFIKSNLPAVLHVISERSIYSKQFANELDLVRHLGLPGIPTLIHLARVNVATVHGNETVEQPFSYPVTDFMMQFFTF